VLFPCDVYVLHCLAAVGLMPIGGTLYIVLIQKVNIRAQFCAIRVIYAWNRLPPRIVTADTFASFVKGINSLGAHFLVPDFDYSDCSFFLSFLLWAAISAFHSLAVPPP